MSLNEKATAEVNEHRATFARISADPAMPAEEKAQGMVIALDNLAPHFDNLCTLGNKPAVFEILAELVAQTPAEKPYAPVIQQLARTDFIVKRHVALGS